MFTTVMTLGATRTTGALELLGTEQPGRPRERIMTTATTRLVQGLRTRTGSDVLVDVEHDGGEQVAVFVRGLAPPHQVDVARFEAALAAFRRAGVPRLVRAPVHDAVSAVFTQLLGPVHDTPTHPRLPWDPRDYLTTVFRAHRCAVIAGRVMSATHVADVAPEICARTGFSPPSRSLARSLSRDLRDCHSGNAYFRTSPTALLLGDAKPVAVLLGGVTDRSVRQPELAETNRAPAAQVY